MIKKATIFALSSGPGRAGIAVVRVSGPAAGEVFGHFGITHPPAPRVASVRKLLARSGAILDQALVLWLPGPGTATGEDMAELHLHGSPAIVSAVLRDLADLEGAELAGPGDFTRRAFANDRLDLVQVEGLADLLSADTEVQRNLAMRQFLGDASSIYEGWRGDILRALALVEASIDFSDENDVAETAFHQAAICMAGLADGFESALAQADQVAAIRRGLRIVIAGPPNAGKSSLLNWLAGREAAIVSPAAGTTRDVVEASLVLEGVPVLLADTAGLRDATDDAIEREGMRRSMAAIAAADVLVWVEASDDRVYSARPRTPDVLVMNKIDLADSLFVAEGKWPVSARSGAGLEEFKAALVQLIRERNHFGGDAVVVRERHRVALTQALTLIRSALAAQPLGLEFVAEDMRKAAKALAGVTGRIDVEDLLGKIFQDFCIGK
jgi:tRNA modification GTPase